MQDALSAFAEICSKIDFGKVEPPRDAKCFYTSMNHEILYIIESLPSSVHADTVLFLLRHLQIPMQREIEFLKGFYPPSWSILYWLFVSFGGARVLPFSGLRDYFTIHASAMLLHLLDDHLTDGELPVTHLTLLLRSQIWMFMNRALNRLTATKERDSELVRYYIDLYYSSIGNCGVSDALNDYCRLFKRQMGLGYLAPVLMTRKMTGDDCLAMAVVDIFGAFGTAWRLLDDLQDIPADMKTNTKSAVYVCLPERMKRSWESCMLSGTARRKHAEAVIQTITGDNIIEHIQNRICKEIHRSAAIADESRIQGYSHELVALTVPFKNSGD